MVTATAILALSAVMAPEPLAARPRHRDHVAPSHEPAKPQPNIASQVPLPQPRPAEAPPRSSTKTVSGNNGLDEGDGKNEGKEQAAAPPPPSACRLALTDEIAIAPSVPAIHDPGGCGGDDLVRLEAVVLPNKTRVALTPPGIMRCTMATAVVNWIRDDVAPAVAKLGSEIRALDNFESYECRGRNGDGSAHLSEHGRANAIDVHGFKLADGRMIDLTDRTQPRDFRESVLHSACTRFPTVLGPDSDWHHENHIHLDLIERRNNYRICQWDVLDPMPKVAPLLPEPRPNDAPPREVAQAAPGDKAKGQADAKSGAVGEVNGSQAETEGAGDKSKAGNDRTGKEAKQDARAPTGKAATETSVQASAPPKPASAAAPPAKTPVEATKDKPETKPMAETHVGAGQAAAGKSSTEKNAADRTSTKKATMEKSSAEKSSSEAGATEQASRKKGRAEKPAQRRHRHRSRMWNPFGSLF
jgi:hypothetical protein